jgi:hypothetical protein
MNLNFLSRKLGPAVGLAGVLALLAASGGATAAPQSGASAVACTVSKNVEVIEDVSGSMNGTDPDNFRAKLMSAYLGLGGNQGKILGAVTFATDASVLFAPQPINAGTRPTMEALFTGVTDNGGTDYQAGFTLANSSNPGASSRIFLSDGEPNAFPTAHLTPKVKTYVVGLGVGNNSSAVQTLTQIASETGGPPPIFIEEAAQLQPAAGAITAGQNCKKVVTFTDTFVRRGQQFGHSFKAQGKAADILTTWANVGSLLDLIKVKAVLRGRPLSASAALAQSARVRTQKKKGTNFTTIRIKGLKKGAKVKFKVKAKAVSGTTVGTTQVIR